MISGVIVVGIVVKAEVFGVIYESESKVNPLYFCECRNLKKGLSSDRAIDPPCSQRYFVGG
jgi:hypothetical protein